MAGRTGTGRTGTGSTVSMRASVAVLERDRQPAAPERAGGDPTALEACPSFLQAMAIIGRRWNGLIIQAMAKGCHSFTEISRFAQRLSDTSLSRRLKDLEDEGLIIRKVIDERPVRVRYSLTEAGAALAPVLDSLTEWGEQYALQRPTGVHGAVTAHGGERA